MLTKRRGFTVVEMVIVVLLVGVVAAVAIPRALKSTPRQQVDRTARQLARDLELVRMRAIAAKRHVLVSFDVSNGFYTAFMDLSDERSGEDIAENADAVRASGLVARGSNAGLPGVELPKRIRFGSGAASGSGPLDYPTTDPVVLSDDRIQFDVRGMAVPLGSDGVIYLVHEEDPSAVAAVTISGGGAFQSWRYRDGSWVK